MEASTTDAFNTAAEGPMGDPTPVETGHPVDLGGGASEPLPGEWTPDEEDAQTPETQQTVPPLGPAFEEAAAPVETDGPMLTGQSEGYVQTLVPPESPAEDSLPSIEHAEAELAQLEAGRPTPALNADLRPPRRLEREVHAELERQREMRITALKAYIEFAQEGPEHAAGHQQAEDLELSF